MVRESSKTTNEVDNDLTLANKSPDVGRAPPIAFRQLFRYASPFELVLNGIGLLAAVMAGVAQPLMSLIFGDFTQQFVSFGSAEAEFLRDVHNATALRDLRETAANFRGAAASDGLYLVYIGTGTLVCTFIYMTIWVYTGEVNAKRIREKYLQAVLRQEIAYFDAVGAGKITKHIQTDTHLVQQGISEKVAIIVCLVSSFFTSFILAYVRCWRLALAMSSILPCMMIAGGIMHKFVSKYIQLSLTHVTEGAALAEEVISSIRTAHSFSIQNVLTGLYDVHVRAARVVDTKSAIFNGVGLSIFLFVVNAAYALAFQFGTTLINQGYANAGEVINVLLAIIFGSFSLATVALEMQAVTTAQAAAGSLFAAIERVPNIDSSDPGGLKPDKVVGEIVLEDVKFDYPSRPGVPVIRGANITFAAGKTTALVGASGSGKSTIISLVERFYDPLSGSVQLDGVDLHALNVKWLRSQVGLVSQEPVLFATTIRDNVAHGLINTCHERLPEEEKFRLIEAACVKANADRFIRNLPDGYNTIVGERGVLLSGGQKQRVAIARAIVSDPRVLLLDEATSALDMCSEEVVQDALNKAAAGRTTIMVAHRLSTIKDAHCIYVMGEGSVLEAGTHAELLADECSAYSRLVNAQRLRETIDGKGTSAAGANEQNAGESKEPPFRKGTSFSAAAVSRVNELGKDHDDEYDNPFDLFVRIGLLDREGLWKYAAGSVFAMMTGMCFPSLSIVYGRAISGFSEINPSIRQNDGNSNALWIFIIAVLTAFATAFQTYFFACCSASLTSRLRSLSFRAILRKDIAYFDKEENSTGSLIANLSDDPQKVNGLAGVTFGALVQSISTLIGGSIIGLLYAWKPAFVAIACVPLLVSTGFIRLYVVVLKDQRNKSAQESSAQLACEAAASIRTVASLTREEDCLELYGKSLEEPLRRSNRAAAWSSLLYAFSQSVILFVIALVFWYGAQLVSRRELSTTAFFTCLMSTTFGAMQAGSVFAFVPDISSARSAGAAIIKLIGSTPDVDAGCTGSDAVQRENVRGQIVFENVHFRYPTRPGVLVLRNLSFTVQPGTHVALVGASGCGKSTVVQLIERFYDPLFGRILLDGRPIDELDLRGYRSLVALVAQEPMLYAGTVRFNLLLGATEPECAKTPQEVIEAACRDANILDFIQSLPEGFETQVGRKGARLSVGQKQRIAIARALLRHPKVLLLDEATSALDASADKVVQEALDRATKGRTTITIAHRLSTIQNADCIYFIKDGRISEAGTHDELLARHGEYHEYVRLQALNKEDRMCVEH